MAEGKKSFVLYADQKELFEQLPNEKAGELIKHIFAYVNDEDPNTEDLLIKMAFTPIKQQLKRDLDKWASKKVNLSNNGVLGNLKRWHKDIYDKIVSEEITIEEGVIIANDRKGSPPDQVGSLPVADIAVNDTVTVNANVNDTIAKKELFDKFWDYYGKKVDRKKCEKKFLSLNENQLDKIKKHLPQYIKANSDIQYRKNPLTYLNGECWNDEIIEATKKEVWNGDNSDIPTSAIKTTGRDNIKATCAHIESQMFMYCQQGFAKDELNSLYTLFQKNYKDFEYYEQHYEEGAGQYLAKEQIANGLRQIRELATKNGVGQNSESK